MIYIVNHDNKNTMLPEGFFNPPELEQVTMLYSIDDLPNDIEHYYYHFDCQTSTIFSLKRFRSIDNITDTDYSNLSLELAVPQKVKDDVKAGKCIYILDQALEGFWHMKWPFFENVLGCERDKFIWLSGDFNCTNRYADENIDARFVNWWERNCSRLNMYNDEVSAIQRKQLELIKNKAPREFYNTFYNRRIREHRLLLMLTLHKEGVLDEMIYSWGGRVDGSYLLTDDRHWRLCTKLTGDDSEEMYETFKEVFDWGNEFHNKDRENLHTNLVNTINGDDIFKTCYQLIVETHATKSDTTFISEKAYKPFVLGQPFLLWGDPHTIDALRWHGYDVFDKWIDHSYDTEWDPKERVKLLTAEVKRLNNLSKEQWTDMLYDMRDAIESNMKNIEHADSRWGLNLNK